MRAALERRGWDVEWGDKGALFAMKRGGDIDPEMMVGTVRLWIVSGFEVSTTGCVQEKDPKRRD